MSGGEHWEIIEDLEENKDLVKNFIKRLLDRNPNTRMKPEEALHHSWMYSE